MRIILNSGRGFEYPEPIYLVAGKSRRSDPGGAPSVGQTAKNLGEGGAVGAEDGVQGRIEMLGHGPSVAVEHDAERLFVVEGGLVGPLRA